ncbi:DNA topoisomerase 3 [Commensalibacter nepenthis]|uniref:DNA topoisomerase n=1 Tax=Commensalibacter nepenthis TaxID=3043872 RepID=A0ABT6QAS6_9PROT|nr:DNA topoisomerase 3 [Commensalibacter sp. TBRC 10068]MDI2113896.1 DNA topoisomerase 3 [Commensalibacter sp. TBRC 10068]
MKLIIAEKPSVGRAIAESLGVITSNKTHIECKNNHTVIWCFGHLFELASPEFYLNKESKIWLKEDLPIFPDNWQLLPKPASKTQLKLIGDLLKKSDLIIHAGDPDREGQLLIDEILDYFHNKKIVKRFWCSTPDQRSITTALNNLEPNEKYKSWGKSAYARALADWLIGMNLTRANTLAFKERGGRDLIVIGRVKTPTLNLIVERCNQIENFKPIPYFKIKAIFDYKNHKLHTLFKPKEDQKGLDQDGRLIDLDVVKTITATVKLESKGIISNNRHEKKSIGQPKGLSGAGLGKIAFNLYGYSAQKTLDLSQALYEKKVTSYPRTDCEFLSENQYQESKEIIDIIANIPQYKVIIDNADLTIKSSIWNDKKITAHHAIIPTFHSFNIDILSKDEANLYDIIVKNYISQFYPKHEYNLQTITITCGGYDFGTSVKTILQSGWKSIFENDEVEDQEQLEDQELTLDVLVDDPVLCSEINFSDEKTKPPAYFTDSSIIEAMINIHKYVSDEYKKYLKETDGIGTIATRAMIIEELSKKEYIERQGKGKKSKIIATNLGKQLINSVSGNIKEPAITAVLERHLQSIQDGSGEIEPFLNRQKEFVIKELERAFDPNRQNVIEIIPCPDCGADLIRRTGQKGKGKTATKYDFFGCSGYPKCKSSFKVSKDGQPEY